MTNRENILIVGGGIVETDGERYYARAQILEYLLGLNQAYKEVTWLVRLVNNRDYKTTIDDTGIRLDIINKARERILSARGIAGQIISYWKFARKLDRNTDVIVSEYSVTSMPYLLLARLFGRRSLYYLGSDPRLTKEFRKSTLYGRFSSWVKILILPISVGLASGVLVRGKSAYAQCVRWNSNIILSNPLISYEHFRSVLSRKVEARERDEFDILYVGKLEENKGVHVLLDALELLQQKLNNQIRVKLNIIGSGDMEDELIQLAESKKIGSLVEFHGFIDDPEKLADIFSASDLFVVPTLYNEGFPRVIDEAMVCGIPVICSRLGGMKADLDENQVIFFSPGDVSGLCDSVLAIMSDEKLRARLKASSIERATTTLNNTAAEQHAQFLDGLA